MIPVTLAITTYNRPGETMRAFRNVQNRYDILPEILISDDCSDSHNAELLSDLLRRNRTAHPDTRCIFLQTNIGMMRNKMVAVQASKYDWVILFDSDNIIDERYINALKVYWDRFPPQVDTIYLPSFAMPHFDMRAFEGQIITKKNVKYFVGKRGFSWLMNVCNYVVPRENYLKVFEYNADIKATDTLFFAINWLAAGFKFVVVPGMVYEHTVHDGSEFKKDMDYNMRMAAELEKKFLTI